MDYPENYLLLEKLRSSNHDSSSRDKLLHLLLSKTSLFITIPNEGCLLSFLHPVLSRKVLFFSTTLLTVYHLICTYTSMLCNVR